MGDRTYRSGGDSEKPTTVLAGGLLGSIRACFRARLLDHDLGRMAVIVSGIDILLV